MQQTQATAWTAVESQPVESQPHLIHTGKHVLEGSLLSSIHLAVFLNLWKCEGGVGALEALGDRRDYDRARQAIVHQV